MKILVAYATSEGQTRKISRKLADQIVESGHSVELAGLADLGEFDPARFDGIVLAASIHVGHYQKVVSEFAARNADRLRQRRTLFLSVSLAAAGHSAEDWRGLEHILEDFEAATGWTPDRVEQVAGAYVPSQYDIFRRFVMRRIVAVKDPEADLDADHEYTDWAKLSALVEAWLAGIAQKVG